VWRCRSAPKTPQWAPVTDADHRVVRGLTNSLDPATLRQVTSWLELTRTTALTLRGAEQAPLTRPVVRRSWF
jgi:hypothetical protein